MAEFNDVEDLKDFEGYRKFLRKTLSTVGSTPEPCFVSRAKFDFDIKGSVFKSHAVILGRRARSLAKSIKAGKVQLIECTVQCDGKLLVFENLPGSQLKGVEKTFKRLKLPWTVDPRGASNEDEDETAESSDLGGEVRTYAKVVQIWQRTEVAAKAELRKLQRAIQSSGDPRGRAVIRGLETILTRIDSIEAEAKDAARAARDSDRKAFDDARETLVSKMHRMRSDVDADQLIRDAEKNPLVDFKLRETVTRSLDQLLKAV